MCVRYGARSRRLTAPAGSGIQICLHVKTIVIIPALNEASSIDRVIDALPDGVVDLVLVVDNGSTDETAAAAQRAGATVVSEPRKGYGRACLKGMDEIAPLKPDVVVFLDGDFSDYPEEITRLLSPIERGEADFVVGSRMTGKREKGALLPQARYGNQLAGMLIKWIWGVRFTDLGPFRAIRFPALLALDMQDKTYGWTVEMQIKAAQAGLRCLEVPVSYRKRIGTSKVTGTVSGTVKASVRILWLIFRYAIDKKGNLSGR